MFLLSGIRFGSVRFDLFRFGPPRRNGTPHAAATAIRRPDAAHPPPDRFRLPKHRNHVRTPSDFRAASRRLAAPCPAALQAPRPPFTPLLPALHPATPSRHTSAARLRSSPVLSGPLRSSPVLSGRPQRAVPVARIPRLVLPFPATDFGGRPPHRPPPTTLTASAARRSRQDARSVFPLFRGRPGSTAELNRPGLFGPALRSGRSGRCLTPAFRPESAPPRSSAPGSGFRFPVSGPTPPRCPAP